MATSVRLIRRYVWLIDTIRRAGNITLEEINQKWMENRTLRLEDEDDFPERTFHRHRQAIADIFGIDILCNRFNGNTYYIENDEALNEPSFTSWLFNGLAIDNQMMNNRAVSDRIVFEDSSGSNDYLSTVIEAITKNRYLTILYQRFNSEEQKSWKVMPILLKQSNQRWYLIAEIEGQSNFTVFALDRIESASLSDREFHYRWDIDDIKKRFNEVIGVNIDDDFDCEKVVLRVYGKQRSYVDSLPIHSSQKIKNVGRGFTDYEFTLRPEYEFQHEILRLGPDAEILSPQWLREEIKWLGAGILKRYEQK